MRPRVPIVVLLTALALPAFADEIQLKDGRVVKGVIVEDRGNTVRIKTADGKTLRFKREEVSQVAESPEIGDEEVDARIAGADANDPHALFEIAKWAKEARKNQAWRLVAELALRLDPGHEELNVLLGNEKVGGQWYKDPKEAEAARKKLVDEEMEAKGYIRWRGGWISREDKALADKDPKAFELVDGVWRDKATVMKEKGYVLVNGKWVKAGTEEDKNDMARFKELIGEDIWVITTPHFRLFVQQYPADEIDEFGKLAEQVYDWFLEQMDKPKDHPLFRGSKGHLWVLKDRNAFSEWLKHYKTRYGFSDETVEFFSKGGGNAIGNLVGITTPNQSRDIRNLLVHQVGHFLIGYFSPGLHGTPAWLGEAMANHCEHVHCGNGTVTCVTRAVYGGEGGRAHKEFSTKDAKDRAKGMIREGSDEPFENLAKIELNSLSGDHLVKGWTIIDWLITNRRKELIAWLEGANTNELLDALAKAIEGWTAAKLDDEWRSHAKKNF